MIKVVNLVSLIAAPIIVKYSQNTTVSYAVGLLLLVAVGWAIVTSKKPAKPLDIKY
jgi:predicted ABC-type exoprotein transport system permease subunit